ncbi:hypothetical protein [Amycolatopsis rifamycinica]|uniref:Uncharacterized protein n=1 Tax=Amycolatopsis rifamycinica TaxID=287986 RepID=A0A066U4W4_9PSEU|nr:hypothetical protein [Amycolatopsis rifamycinica]KDN22506.1 hypothetical protein DV20_09635 [Amycolatopsis rifamycinica]
MTGAAIPSRWQIDILVYEEEYSYPVLLLQPGRPEDHRRLLGLLARAGLAAATTWEWQHGFWPLAAGCEVALAEGPAAVTVHVGGHSLTVGFEFAEPPPPWLAAARRQRQVLFVLLPPRPHAADDALIIDDVSRLVLPAERGGCLVGAIPLAGH